MCRRWTAGAQPRKHPLLVLKRQRCCRWSTGGQPPRAPRPGRAPTRLHAIEGARASAGCLSWPARGCLRRAVRRVCTPARVWARSRRHRITHTRPAAVTIPTRTAQPSLSRSDGAVIMTAGGEISARKHGREGIISPCHHRGAQHGRCSRGDFFFFSAGVLRGLASVTAPRRAAGYCRAGGLAQRRLWAQPGAVPNRGPAACLAPVLRPGSPATWTQSVCPRCAHPSFGR